MPGQQPTSQLSISKNARSAIRKIVAWQWDMRTRGAHTKLLQHPSALPDISIVIPVYNAMPFLERTLQSLLQQTYPLERIEIIAIDDASDDGSSNTLACYATQTNLPLQVISLPSPSGSPAHPRNTGLAIARGTYVFFLDADDWLDAHAIEYMLDHAIRWNSDILLVKMVGENGRVVPSSMFSGGSRPRVDVYRSKVLRTLAPLKLFRRTLVEDLRFPAYMPEDIPFVLRAYCQARVVSVAADIDYYHVSLSPERDHASLGTWRNVASNMACYTDVLGYIQESIPASQDRIEVLCRLFNRDFSHTLETLRTDSAQAQQFQQAFAELIAPYFPTVREYLAPETCSEFETFLSVRMKGTLS